MIVRADYSWTARIRLIKRALTPHLLLSLIPQIPQDIQPISSLMVGQPFNGTNESRSDRLNTGESQNVALKVLETVGKKEPAIDEGRHAHAHDDAGGLARE